MKMKRKRKVSHLLALIIVLSCISVPVPAMANDSISWNLSNPNAARITTPMHRLYNPNSGEHFYTGSEEERDNLTVAGWQYEGIAWNAPVSEGMPVYRVFNPNSGDHHYTMSQEEVDNLLAIGWLYEGVAWNSAPITACTIPQYRLYNPNASIGSHHYTGSKEERDFLTSVGWIYEGIGWYGVNNHTWGDWIIVKEATLEENGEYSRECTVCGYSESVSLRDGNSRYGYYAFANETKGKEMQNLYKDLYDICEDFSNNDQDLTNLTIASIDYDVYGLTLDEAVSVWKIFFIESPRYYWLSNTITIVDDKVFGISIDEAYAKANYRQECDAAIETMVEDCARVVDGEMSELEKALAIHNFTLNRMNYAYESDGVTPQDAIWAHNIIGCAKEGLGVCDSYAKTYMYLCLLNNIECIIVTGEAGNEDHAWNLICLDNKWYAVDVTWDETNINSEVAYNFFGLSFTAINCGHTADRTDNFGLDYLYKLPEISDRSIELVKLYADNVLVDIFANIDQAFAAMTDNNAEYRIELCDYKLECLGYESAGFMITTPQDIIYTITSDITPDVKAITIKGHKIDGYDYSTVVYIEDELLINSNIILENASLNGERSFDLQNYSLITTGSYCDIAIPISGSMNENGSSVIVRSSDGATFGEAVSINSFLIEGDGAWATVRFTGEVNINHVINNYSPTSIVINSVNHITHESRINNLYGGITIEDNNTVIVEHIYESTLSGISILFRFGKEEEYPTFITNEINCPVTLMLDGTKYYFSYDLEGNYNEWTEEISPFDLTQPIAYIKDTNDFIKITIFFEKQGYVTDLYKVNEDGGIYLK